MHPFIDLHFIKLPSYGLCLVLGLTIATLISYFVIRKQGKCFWDFVIISVLCVSFGFFGAKLLFLIVTYPLSEFFPLLLDIITGKNKALLSGGFVFYGGIIGGVIGAIIGSIISKGKIRDYIDLYGFLVPFVHAFGRVGCFCAGCCYGIPYDGPFSVVYKNPISSVPVGIGIFPVQLLEALLLLLLSITLLIMLLKGKKDIFITYIMVYAVIRFTTEFFRYDRERGFIGILSVSQVISIILFTLSLSLLIIRKIVRIRQSSHTI